MAEPKPDPLLSSADVKLNKDDVLRELREALADLLGRYGEVSPLTCTATSDGSIMIQAVIRKSEKGKERAQLVERRRSPSPEGKIRKKA